jgi:hypothetical protein
MRVIAGWLGAFLLGLCSLPLLAQTIADGRAPGVSMPFLFMWWGGELLMLEHVRRTPARTWPMILNCAVNLAAVTVVLFYGLVFS